MQDEERDDAVLTLKRLHDKLTEICSMMKRGEIIPGYEKLVGVNKIVAALRDKLTSGPNRSE